MTKNSANADVKKRARALVAQVKQRLARQQGAPAPETDEEGAEGAAAENQGAEAEGMEARSAQAKGVRKQKALAQSHVTRAQGHAAARTQRTQGRREGK